MNSLKHQWPDLTTGKHNLVAPGTPRLPICVTPGWKKSVLFQTAINIEGNLSLNEPHLLILKVLK